MNGHSRVTRTGSGGSTYSDVSSGDLDSSFRSTGNGNGFPTNRMRPDTNLEKLLNQLPGELRQTTWEVRNEIAKRLDPLKDPVGNDYRLVGSRLGFPPDLIDQFGKAARPTLEMIKLCNTTSSQEFFSVIQSADRSDVIDDLLSYLTRISINHHHLPTQASQEDESVSSPFEESCSDVSKLSKQPSEHKESDEETEMPIIPFQTSKEFWKGIPGPYSHKKWRDFCTAMEVTCPKESSHGGIEKFLCHILSINFDSRSIDGEVKVEYFIRLLTCFGPFEPGEDGCLEKMYELMKKSLSRSMDGKKHSWFAGYMSQQDTHERLSGQSPGHFLIRFSGSRVDDGWFILGVKTRDDVVQIEIKREVVNCKHLLADQPFPDLPSIVEKLRQEIFLQECRQLLINPCPDLPLNTNFNGYTAVSRAQGRGRGRKR